MESVPDLKKDPDLLKFFDAIEVHNGEAALWLPFITPRRANQRAQEFYDAFKYEFKIGRIVTSDGHSLNEIGTSWTRIYMPIYSEIGSAEQLIDSLRGEIKATNMRALSGVAYEQEHEQKMNSRFMAAMHSAALLPYMAKGLVSKIISRKK